MSERLVVYLFLPLRLGPSSGSNGRRVKELLRLAAKLRPPARVIDFVDDLRLVKKSGGLT